MSATDPVKKIKRSPVSAPLPPILKQLAALPPQTDTPYITATLDWRPDGETPAERSSIVSAWNDLKTDMKSIPERGESRSSLDQDIEKITSYLENDVDPAARGVHIVANSGHGVFEADAIGLPLPTAVSIGPIPALKSLTRVIEDHPLYAILVMDQREATLSFVSSAGPSEAVSVTGSDYPRHQKQGGWSQQRFQTRANERVEAFTRTVAKEVERAIDATGIRRLVFSADEVSGPPFLDALDDTTKSKIIGTFRTEVDAPMKEILRKAQPIAEEFERQRESEIVDAVSDAVGSGNRGVSGPADTLSALLNGQVHELAMVGRFEAEGWADYTMAIAEVGSPPATHPAGGSPGNMVPVQIEEEMIRLAISADSLVDIVTGRLPVLEDEAIPDPGTPAPRSEASEKLEALGSVAAILRYEI